MELDSQNLRGVWWKGALKGLTRGMPIGMAVGICGGAFLFGLASVFGLFPVLPFLATLTTVPALTGAGIFFPLPLMLVATALTAGNSFFNGGRTAVGEYKKDLVTQSNTTRIKQLESNSPAPQPVPEGILQSRKSFVAAEKAREQSSASYGTMH